MKSRSHGHLVLLLLSLSPGPTAAKTLSPRLYSGGGGDGILVWTPADQDTPVDFFSVVSFKSLSVNAVSGLIATGHEAGAPGIVKIWNSTSGGLLGNYSLHTGTVAGVAFSPDVLSFFLFSFFFSLLILLLLLPDSSHAQSSPCPPAPTPPSPPPFFTLECNSTVCRSRTTAQGRSW